MRWRDILHEGSTTQGFIEHLADRILAKFAELGPARLRDAMSFAQGKSLRNPQLLGVVTIGQVAPLLLPQATPNQQRFLQQQADLEISFSYPKPHYIAIYITEHPSYKHNLIIVTVPDEPMEILADHAERQDLQSRHVAMALQVRRSELVHELAHAYDDALSGGKYRTNARSRVAQHAVANKTWNRDLLYFNDPIEINARLTAAMAHHQANAATLPFPEFARVVRHDFVHWGDVPERERRLLSKRIAGYWLAQRAASSAASGNSRQATK